MTKNRGYTGREMEQRNGRAEGGDRKEDIGRSERKKSDNDAWKKRRQ